MARSSARSRKPWWLVLLLAAAAYLYKTYVEPPPTRNASTRTTREASPREPSPRTTAPRETSRSSSSRTRDSQSSPSPKMEGGATISDVVIKVSDGDTVKLEKTGTVRLIGIDSPELHFQGKSQPGGEEAGDFARRALLDKSVRVQLCAKQPYDRYGRGLAFIYLLDKNGKEVLFNREMVKQGYARVYSLRPCTIDENAWNADYEDARRAQRGLFGTLGDIPDAAAFRRAGRR